LIWGAFDRTIPLEFGRRLEKDLPRARLTVLEGAGHVPNQERPEKVLDLLSTFPKRDE